MIDNRSSYEKNLMKSYWDGIRDSKYGVSYIKLMSYFAPEFITALVIYFLPICMDLLFVGQLKSTSSISTLGVTNALFHFITKIAEALSVGIMILGGEFNGANQPKKVGQALTDAFWMTVIVGGFFFCCFFFGATLIFNFYGVTSPKMLRIGVPYLRLRAVGILLTFIFFAAIGFLRSIKNTHVPMLVYSIGALVFVLADWILIFGKCWLPACGLQGSAWATIIQSTVMIILAYGYIFLNPRYRIYELSLFESFGNINSIKRLFALSWRVVIDKATVAFAYIWLSWMLTMDGKYGLASFTIIRQMQSFIILPAVAFSQVITFVVSNEIGAKNWIAVKSTVKKVFFMTTIFVSILFVVLLINSTLFVGLIDHKGKVSQLSLGVFPFISILAFFDLLQLVLSGALRGAANVSIVMWVRLIVILLFFIPVSYLIKVMPMESDLVKFVLIYGAFYIGTGVMNIAFIERFRSDGWKKHIL